MFIISIFEAWLSAALYAAVAVVFFQTRSENVPQREKWCRDRWIGLLLTLPAALYCVPLAQPVTPLFLLPWLWPMALILPLLCLYLIDYYASRGLALWMITAGYGMIHSTFEWHVPGSGAVAVLQWLAGIAAIWISAKPCLLRDLFRKSAENVKLRYVLSIAAAVMSLAALYSGIMIIVCGGR